MCARRVATHGSIVALPSGERDRRGGSVGEREPPLGLGGPRREHAEPCSGDRQRGVPPQLVLAEPPQPLLQGLHAAVVVQRQRERIDQAGDGVRLARRVPVDDRRLGQVVVDAPRHRPPVQRAHDLGLAALELVPQQLAEQVVVAIPLAPPVERDQEAVGALERLERVRRPRRLEHRVTQRAAHPIEHRGVHEEPRLRLRQPGQELEAEVLRHESVLAREARGGHGARRPGLHRQRGEVQPGRPPLGPLGQRGHLGRVELDARRLKQQPCLSLVQSEVRHADLLHPSMSAPAGDRQCRRLSARNGDLRPGRNVLQQCRDDVETRRTGDRVQIVEHQHQRALEPGQRTPDTRHSCRPRGPPGSGQRLEHRRRERLDAVDRRRDVSQEHHCVVVTAVERDPRERTRIRVGPTREQRRLAVAGRCDHGREGRARRAQPRDDVRLRHGSGSDQRRSEFGLRQIEGNVRIKRRRAHASSSLGTRECRGRRLPRRASSSRAQLGCRVVASQRPVAALNGACRSPRGGARPTAQERRVPSSAARAKAARSCHRYRSPGAGISCHRYEARARCPAYGRSPTQSEE